jgi:hypothetical protein
MNSTVLANSRIALVLVLAVLTTGLRAAGKEPNSARAERSATIQERTIQLKPSGAEFQIPESWLEWHAQFKNNLHLSRAELEKVRNAVGEWDREYAEVVNAVLPYSKCAVHVGDEGWGRDSVSFADLQVRAYIVEMTPQQVLEKVSKDGAAQAAKFSKEVSTSQGKQEDWQRASVSYSLWYGDYGGKAKVDFYSRTFGKRTAVLVFMHAWDKQPIVDIVKSFKWEVGN